MSDNGFIDIKEILPCIDTEYIGVKKYPRGYRYEFGLQNELYRGPLRGVIEKALADLKRLINASRDKIKTEMEKLKLGNATVKLHYMLSN